MKILIVDDSGMMRSILKRALLRLGIDMGDILEADNGQRALTYFDTVTFGLVITDWNMPCMDGLTMLKKIRECDEHVPVIMISREAKRDRVLAAIQAGISDYLINPFLPVDLTAKLEKWVRIGEKNAAKR